MATGQAITILFLATALAVFGAWAVARRYRAVMTRLMSAPAPAAPAPAPPLREVARPPVADLTPADNQRAYRQLVGTLLALSLLMALTRTLIEQTLVFAAPVTWKTVLTLTATYAWPVVPVLGVIGRWSRRRVAAMLGLWFLGAVALLVWRTTAAVSFAAIAGWMAMEIGIPLVMVAAVCLGGATRAVAPWLLPPLALLCAASLAGLEVLDSLVSRNLGFLADLAGIVGVPAVFAGFALLPWLLAWWPVKAMGRRLARAYVERRLSELIYLFTAVWTIALIMPALSAASSLGPAGGVVLLPLLWIPLLIPLARRLSARLPKKPGRPPTLLVLRVFQQDAGVTALFDQVVERWRVTGNTVLIAGTDLVERTLDAEDIFTFLDGRLGERFIRSAGDVPARLGAFQFEPDAEGRYRVNECYCHDQAWKEALAPLLRMSDTVLMDLRGFQARNAGCAYELAALAGTPGLARVVVLTDARTDQPAARAAAAQAPPGRFVWLDAGPGGATGPAQVLAALFPAGDPPPLPVPQPQH